MRMSGRDRWLARSVAERKVLIIAMEQGHLWELLPESYVITDRGREQDFPALKLQEARDTFRRLASEELVGLYPLADADQEFLGDSAIARVEDDELWLVSGGNALCMFLTAAGEQVVGLK